VRTTAFRAGRGRTFAPVRYTAGVSPPRRSGTSDKITFSVRLSAAEHERLQALAAAAGVDASTLLRSWIGQGRPRASPGPAVPSRGRALPSAPQPRQIPRWWLLPPRLHVVAKAVDDACGATPVGVVLLEEVIYGLSDAGVMEVHDASDRMWELTGNGWIAQRLPEGDVDESYEGKTAFHQVWGALSSYALAMVAFDGVEGRSAHARPIPLAATLGPAPSVAPPPSSVPTRTVEIHKLR